MGEVPRWFRLLAAARYLGTTPWELEDVPWRYILQAEAASRAEDQAARERAEKRGPVMGG